MPKVLITSPTYPPFNSGLGNAAAQQAACLARAGHEVVVATGGGQRRSCDVEGVRVETFALTGASCWLQPIRGDVAAYADFLVRNDWDFVLLNAWQNWATDLALLNLGRIPGRKFVYSHCISTNVFYVQQPIRSLIRFLAWRPYWYNMTRVLRELDGVIFLADSGSDSRFDDLRRATKVGATCYVVPNALSPTAVKSLNKRPLTFLERDRLIAVGSYQWQKGFDFVLRAYSASNACNVIPLHFFGQEHSDFSEQLRRKARALGVHSGYIFFHAGVSGDALQAEYAQAKLVLSGSHTECQPLALLDASASATPFVARATGCIDEMAGGLAIKSWSEMAKQIDKFVENLEHWQSYSQIARTVAETVYHPDAVTQKLLAVLESRALATH
ncbi:glycosyltransferase family 4 protein [Pusillimonas minor]|uniref:Glycosyltransferase family 4 protein n=1 Tax=Pusillimonas minor TaxID=2697024 RepID=A0A842HQX4_9BURK|nr:glycosyltransferase family 4 protein [Pusillimonas minor]MBC2770606.1 glycosyltransferase family 4 protein [Pusillimonas minor]